MNQRNALVSRYRFVCATMFAAAAMFGTVPDAAAVTVAHCTDTGMCPGTGSCTITNLVNVVPGSVLDCQTRAITIAGSGSLKVVDGEFELITGNLTIDGPGGLINGDEGSEDQPAGVTIVSSGNVDIGGKIRVNGNHGGGSLSITATGNITLTSTGDDGIEAKALMEDQNGGEVLFDAGVDIIISDPIDADGSDSGESAGGTVELRAGRNITTNADGLISAQGRAAGGGTITLSTTNGDITLNQVVQAYGRSETGDGGHVELHAGDGLAINQPIDVRGGVNDTGGTAAGGSIDMEAGCGGIAIAANLTATGGSLGSDQEPGAIVASSLGPMTVASGITLDTHGLAPGSDGGLINLDGFGAVTVATNALLDARGYNTTTNSDARGATIRVAGCTVDIQSGAKLDARGITGGSVDLAAYAVAPASGTQPLRVSTGAQVKVLGSTNADNGDIGLSALYYKPGVCSNNGDCFLNSDCTKGCETGTCSAANPDTAGVNTAFDVAPSRFSDKHLVQCTTACN